VREIIEMVLQEEVEAALGAGRSQRVAERAGRLVPRYRRSSREWSRACLECICRGRTRDGFAGA